ncbi:hypothetical protein INS49_013225 [Diaporthe citri]|uniref:uncharacterized protein n=1 Tax=Diaporthe citri TaxID=83186 RepID=UPI001C818296|nr:uncharacterized protein INS49_013225 [Diaporthe citri]KAG6357349.1 hypothetical protein INS49_013225 [Diaporthe citri]
MTETISSSPSKVDSILVVGAGEFGLSLALELRQRGYESVTVLDRFFPPVPDGSSVDVSRIVRSDDGDAPLKKLYPSIQADFSGKPALHHRQGGWADAGASISELAKRCSFEGVAFQTGLRGTVTSLVTPEDPDGSIGVKVATGDVLRARRVVLATGAWTNRLLDAEHALSASGQSVAFVQLTDSEAAELKDCPVMIDFETGVFCFPPYPGTNLLKLAWHSYGVATEVEAGNDNDTTRHLNRRTISAPKLYGRNDNSGFIPEDADLSLRRGLKLFSPKLRDRP